MTDEQTPQMQFPPDPFVKRLFSDVFGADWDKETSEWHKHGEVAAEITEILYGPDEKNGDRWRADSSVSNEVDALMSFATCLVAGEFLVDVAYGGTMQLRAQRAAFISAKRAGVEAVDIARRVSNSNPALFKLFQKRLSKYEILLKKAITELDARIAAARKQTVIPDDSK